MSEPTFPSLPAAPAGGFAAISKYNPHLWSAEQLRAIFVARQNELADILRTLKNTPADEIGQHTLLVGARGMGKSTLMQRLALAVDDDAELKQCWLALRFPEEQYTVSTVGQFWANVLDSLIDALEKRGLPTQALDATAQRIAGLHAGEQAAACLDAINRCADELGQRLMLLVDNTDLLLHNIGKPAHWALREVLQGNPRLLWVGGSYQSLEADSDYHDAFLDFFRVIELRPLRLEEMRQALLALAETFGGAAGRGALEKQLAAHPERLPTLRQLSGGNPRTTVMFYELLSNGQKGDVRSDLEALLDTMTPLYKARMDALADLPRKLLAHILEYWAPITLGQLAESSQVAKGSISPQLQRLELEGLIVKTRLHGTTRNGYQAAERFFNIWYLMRFSPRRQRARLAWLVEFMRLWFSNDELCGLAQRRMQAAAASRCAHDWDYDRALADALPPEAGERHALRWSLLKELKGQSSRLNELFDFDGGDREFRGVVDYLERLEALPDKLRRCPHLKSEDEKQAWVEAILGSIGLPLEMKEKAAEISERMDLSQLDKLKQLTNVERIAWEKEFGKNAIQIVQAAILRHDFFPDMPDSRLAYEQIRACFSEQHDALRLACKRFYEVHEDEWCLKALELALEAAPQDNDLIFRRAWLLHERLGLNEEAENAYREVIARNETDSWAWCGLGRLLEKQNSRHEEAEAAYRRAIALDKKRALHWFALAGLLEEHDDRYQEAELAYQKAIALDEKNDLGAWPWHALGNLLRDHQDRYEEAETAYRKAISVDEKNAWPWIDLGDLLQDHLGRYEEAEAAYRHATTVNERSVWPWLGLGRLLLDHFGRASEAEAAFRQAIFLDESDAPAKARLANLLWVQGRIGEAEALYRAVVERTTEDEMELLVLSHLALNNRQLAVDALQNLAASAEREDVQAFYGLKELVWESHELGLGVRLADWMADCEQAVFLLPFTQSLYQLAGETLKLQDLPQETQQMADEIVRIGQERIEKRNALRGKTA